MRIIASREEIDLLSDNCTKCLMKGFCSEKEQIDVSAFIEEEEA